MKKILSVIICILMIGSMFSYSYAATTTKNKLDIVEKSAEELELENKQGKVSKTIVDITEDEVTIELKLANARDDINKLNQSEIMLVIDKSGSMEDEVSGNETRKNLIFNSAKTLVEKIFNSTSNVKVGVVTFSSSPYISSAGTINDAAVELQLSDNKQAVLGKLNEIQSEEFECATNIEAGIKQAESCYTAGVSNRVMIILTDGIPNCDIEEVKQHTREALTSTQTSGINLISMMTGVEDSDDQEVVEEVFGTQTNPTAGKFYNISDTDIGNIVENEIFKDVMQIIQYPIDEVKMVDYFPEDVMDNFEFSYVGEPNLGEVSSTIDPESKTITWDVGTVRGNESAVLTYKLKLKDLNDNELLNKVIATNEKVELTYKDKDAKVYNVTLSGSPKIKLVQYEVEDDSVSPNILSKTGEYSAIVGGIALIAVFIITYKKYKKMNF